MKRLEDLLPSQRLENLELNIRAALTFISWLEGKVDDMNDKVDVAMKHMDDVVAYAASVVDAVKKALEYLRAHQGDDKDLEALAGHVEAKMVELEEKLHEVGASGGV